MSGQTLLDVRGLSIRFPQHDPVRGLSFCVNAGETLAIVGESGSGKSLTALALMRLLPRAARIAEGEVRFNGHDLLQLNEQSMRRLRGREIGMIFQEPMTSLNPVYSVGWQIAEVLRQHEGLSARSARLRAVELLDTVRIPDPQRRVDDFPHQLSGGMRQRVAIAMAIAGCLFVIPTAAEIPIVQTMMLAGMGTAPALALLITLPAISLPSLIMLRKSFPAKALWLTAGLVALSGVMVGSIALM